MRQHRRRYTIKNRAPVATAEPEKTEFNFANVSDWLDHCTGPCELDECLRLTRRTNRPEYFATDTFEQALDLARHGWQEGVDEIRKITAEIVGVSRSASYAKTFRPHRVGGGTLLMGRYLQNIPECYLKLQQTRINRFVTVVVNGSASVGVKPDVLLRRGATIAAMIEVLELQRVRVRVELVNCWSGDSGIKRTWRVLLKDFNDSLDIDRLAFFLAHASSLRRFVFSAFERLPRADRIDLSVPGHYGHPEDIDEGRGDIYLPAARLTPQWMTVESCAQFLRSTLRDQGIEV